MEPDDDKTQTHIVLTKGTMVSHYRIIEKIGAGGMGEVYLAEDTELDRKVALKFLPPHLCQDDDCRKRFKREAQAAAKLSHPNIVTIHEVGEHQTRPYIVMEHVEGRSLRDVEAEELDIDRIIGIAIQLCDGLRTAHAAGVIHRDIKPSNIVIDSSGRPKLLDFGLAIVKGGEQLTKTGSTLGTIGYMSPEQIEGKSTDARSDLFSLGVVLYELIANKSPFRRDDETATLKAILQNTPEPLARYKSDVPDDLQRIVSKLLEKDQTLRYQSAAGVIPDLKKLSSASTGSMVIEKRRDRWNRYVVPSTVIILLAVVAIWYFGYRDQAPATSGTDDRIMLAVLPFENLGDPEDEYFADGMTDEITGKLATIHGLGVISRTSAMQYKGTDKVLRQVGDELGVDYILEGTIRWDKSGDTERVRIIPQLIQANDDIHIWAGQYDRTITDIFAVQSDISSRVVEALDITLQASEQRTLESRPTDNMEAYGLYLRGLEYLSKEWNQEYYQIAQNMFTRATELDSSFASAYAALARAHTIQYWYFDITEERLALARQAVDRALQLEPDNPMAHLALGQYYYHGMREYDKALSELEIAAQLVPSNAEVYEFMGYVKRRQGKFRESIEYLLKATELDPRSQRAFANLSYSYLYIGEYENSESANDRVIAISPEWTRTYYDKAYLYVAWKGDIDKARQILETASRAGNPKELAFYKTELDIFARDYQTAFDRISNMSPLSSTVLTDSAEFLERKGYINLLMGNFELSNVYYDSARVILESKEVYGQAQRASGRTSSLGRIYARLGQKDIAIQYGKLGVEQCPMSLDPFTGTTRLYDLVIIYIIVGENELALNELENLFEISYEVTVPLLKIDPIYDPLRDHPRFQALIKKYEKEHGT